MIHRTLTVSLAGWLWLAAASALAGEGGGHWRFEGIPGQSAAGQTLPERKRRPGRETAAQGHPRGRMDLYVSHPTSGAAH